MFIGGLNWETTDESLRDYFSQFGEVSECTVMRDGPSGRSRGFGFLTFKDPKTVNIVMVKEHYLDGKIIDPKRAIPRDEQERTSKIFVGGVSQDATEQDFRDYFMQFGRVIDSTLMIDKETGRPRGFGFVTFNDEAAVEAALAHPDLRIHDKPNQNSGGAQDHSNYNQQNNQQANMPNPMNGAPGANPSAAFNTSGISPTMLAQYWQRMQQYMMVMMQQQQQMQMRGGGGPGGQPMGMPNMNNMGNFNPQMMAQMQQMQGMQGMPGGMPGMGMNGMPPQMGGAGGPNQQFNMNPQGGYQPKSPNHGMQQGYGGDGSGNGGQDQKNMNMGQQDPSQMNVGQQMGQPGMWNNGYEDPSGQGGMGVQGNNNRGGMPGAGGNFQNKQNPILNAPTGPKAGSSGPPPNAPTGPRNSRGPPTGPSGGGPHRHQQRKGNTGFHPYQR
ncbi:Nucleolin [Orbilia brochopaga]|nr:Nucleolin [Drechslerella brochopaga]